MDLREISLENFIKLHDIKTDFVIDSAKCEKKDILKTEKLSSNGEKFRFCFTNNIWLIINSIRGNTTETFDNCVGETFYSNTDEIRIFIPENNNKYLSNTKIVLKKTENSKLKLEYTLEKISIK